MNQEFFLNEQLPSEQLALIPQALKTAYMAVDELMRNEPIFQMESAPYMRGYILNWAVDKSLVNLIETGLLRCDYTWSPFSRETGVYLQVRLRDSILTTSQVSSPASAPRRAIYRANSAMGNQLFLLPEVEAELKKQGVPAFLLVHGKKDLTFANIGLPHPDKDGYLYQTGNLLLMPHLMHGDRAGVEATNIEATPTLKEDIRKMLRDNHAG